MIRMPRHASPPSRRMAAAAGVTVIALALPGCSDDEDVPSVTAVEVSAAQGEGDPLRFDTDDIAELLRAQPGELDAVADAEEIVERLLVQFGTIEDDDDDESSAGGAGDDEGRPERPEQPGKMVDAGADSDEVFRELLNLAAADFRDYQRHIDSSGDSSDDAPDRANALEEGRSLAAEEQENLMAIADSVAEHADEDAINAVRLRSDINGRGVEIRGYLYRSMTDQP